MTSETDHFLNTCRGRVDALLSACLPANNLHPQLIEAARYATLQGGKRIRPGLVYAGALACGEISPATDRVASAVELIHTYSLIHDDLPSMDDDALRRGKPSCHIAYDEATAILVGDGLQALAFEQLSLINGLDANMIVALVGRLATASGLAGMVLGQAMDISATNAPVDHEYLETMHRRKTGDLISTSIIMGAMSTGHAQEQNLEALRAYGEAIGLAFQVRDDVLDTCSNTETLGKPADSDSKSHKTTYTSLLGLTKAESIMNDLLTQAQQALVGFGERAEHLRNIARYVVTRGV